MRSRRGRRLAAIVLGLAAAVFVVLVAGGIGATAAKPTPPGTTQQPAQQPAQQPPDRGNTPIPLYTVPPELQFTAPPVAPTSEVRATAPPTPTPPPTPPPTAGPAVGSEVTPPGLVSVPVASLGPVPQGGGGQDPTLVILVVIIGLGLLAIGAFVLAISVQ
jgi:hypothetical protein